MKHVNHFLDQFFYPESIAVVGATNNPMSMNFNLLQNLIQLNFTGKIYPVNPSAEEISGIRAFERLQDIPDKVDLAVSAVPAHSTMDIVKGCDEADIKNLVVISGGFSEGGKNGQSLHQEMAAFAREKGIRILGPNTLSPVNTDTNLVISFNKTQRIRKGGLSFAFQSGFYDPKLNWIFGHLGINKMLDMGNKLDINEVDALDYFSQDPATDVIAIHMESMRGNGRDFIDRLRSVARRKPVVILKSGRTSAGSKAALSHTGAISAENDRIFDCVIRQSGAFRARNIEEFFDMAKAFEFLKHIGGDRMAIITLSGGEGVMATDACEANGFEQAQLTENTRQTLDAILPVWEIPMNPFDAGVCMQFHLKDFQTFFNTLSAIPKDENVDATVMQMPPPIFDTTLMTSQAAIEIAEYLKAQYIDWLRSIKEAGKPFALWKTSMSMSEVELAADIEALKIPVFESSERAVRALSVLYKFNSRKEVA